MSTGWVIGATILGTLGGSLLLFSVVAWVSLRREDQARRDRVREEMRLDTLAYAEAQRDLADDAKVAQVLAGWRAEA